MTTVKITIHLAELADGIKHFNEKKQIQVNANILKQL